MHLGDYYVLLPRDKDRRSAVADLPDQPANPSAGFALIRDVVLSHSVIAI